MKVKCINSLGNTAIGLRKGKVYKVISSSPAFYEVDTGFFGKQVFLKSRFEKIKEGESL